MALGNDVTVSVGDRLCVVSAMKRSEVGCLRSGELGAGVARWRGKSVSMFLRWPTWGCSEEVGFRRSGERRASEP